MTRIVQFLLIAIGSVLLMSCRPKPEASKINSDTDTSVENLVADTIIYDVVVRNTNPYDTWATKSLRGLNHPLLIDSLFGLVYDQQAIAYDYFDGTPLSPQDVKDIENADWFSRGRIGKIQFTEKWYFSKSRKELHKEVISVALGHELYTDSGELRGYKPIFKLQLRH